MIDLTTRCNLNCKYCFRDVNNPENYKSISKEMLNEICKYIFDYCTKHEVKKISIQPWGGEPLLEMEKIKWMYDFLKIHLYLCILRLKPTEYYSQKKM